MEKETNFSRVIAKNIARIIKSKQGLTQADVAERMEITPEAFRCNLSRGNFSISTVQRIADAIGCDITELLANETKENTNIIKCPKCGAELTLKENVPTD